MDKQLPIVVEWPAAATVAGFKWRTVWPALAETLGVDVGANEPTTLAAYIRDNADVWVKIVAKYGPASGDLRSFVGQGDQHADFAFAYGAPAGPVAFVSTIKLRKAGFNAAIDTREAFCGALQSFHRSQPSAAGAVLKTSSRL